MRRNKPKKFQFAGIFCFCDSEFVLEGTCPLPTSQEPCSAPLD